jgi:hypothetical protein
VYDEGFPFLFGEAQADTHRCCYVTSSSLTPACPYIIPFIAKDLLGKILVPDPHSRIKLADIKEHPWMQGPVSGPEPSKGDNAAATAGAPQVRGCVRVYCAWVTTSCLECWCLIYWDRIGCWVLWCAVRQ